MNIWLIMVLTFGADLEDWRLVGGSWYPPPLPFENSILLTIHVYIVKLPNIGLGHPPPSKAKHYATISLSPHPLTPTPGGKKNLDLYMDHMDDVAL